MGSDEITAVRDRTDGGQLLERSRLECLTERIDGKLGRVHFGLIVIDSVDLAREIDAGLARVAERLEILVELIEPESLRRHHQRRVAGLLQTSREGDCAMPGGCGGRKSGLAESLAHIPAGAVELVSRP